MLQLLYLFQRSDATFAIGERHRMRLGFPLSSRFKASVVQAPNQIISLGNGIQFADNALYGGSIFPTLPIIG